jgi:hypothetical protein
LKKTYFHILFLFCLCTVLSTCKHEPEIDPNSSYCGEATTIDEMMEWVYFKTGTYWIYEEQNSGALDTMTVYFDYSGISNTGNREFVVKMESSRDGYTYEYWFNDAWSGECGTRGGCLCRVVDCEKYIPGDFVGGNHVFIFPLFVDNRAGQHGQDLDFGYSRIVEKIDTLILSGTLFLNVYEYSFDYSVQHDYESAEYYLVKNFGIIQKRINSINENWELIEYAINQ